MTIEYVHASHLGTSVAVRDVEDGIVIAMAFSHKASPSGRRNFEQFSRKKGRLITTARANARANGDQPPYTAMLPMAVTVKDAIRAAGDYVHSIEPCVNNEYAEQVDNDEIFVQVVNAIAALV